MKEEGRNSIWDSVFEMSVKLKDDKPTSTSIVGCCQSSSTTPDNSIVDYIGDDFDAPNNNTLYHASNASKDNLI